MTPAQARECAELLCGPYPQATAAAINSYARQLGPYPYRFCGEAVVALVASWEGEFRPSVHALLEALAERYRAAVRVAMRGIARDVYLSRFVEGDEEHQRGWMVRYIRDSGIGTIATYDALQALREELQPRAYIERYHRRWPARDGGPIAPRQLKVGGT